ncbi:MAG TPA: DUF3124 domain-containing protein [bacterium]|nr:DUF3124 domain-containing protein [bacterium]
MRYRGLVLLVVALCMAGCKQQPAPAPAAPHTVYDPAQFATPDAGVAKLRGQLLYLPIYSAVPFQREGRQFDLSAFAAVHNADVRQTVTITRVLYYDTDGKLVKNYLAQEQVLAPLATVDFFVPEEDRSGTGANFVIEWRSDTPVVAPLVESVMVGLANGQGVSFLSTGRVMRQF